MLAALKSIGRFWLVRLFWLIVAMAVLIGVAHVPSGFVPVAPPQTSEGNDGNFYRPKPAPPGYFMIEPWELRTSAPVPDYPVMAWSFTAYRAAVTYYTSQLVTANHSDYDLLGYEKNILDQVRLAAPKTLKLFGMGLVGGAVLGIIAGLLTHAVKLLRPPLLGFAVGGLSVPDFLLVLSGQLLTIWTYKTYKVRLWTVGVPDGERHWMLPTLALAIPVIAYIIRLTMASLDDVLREDYIRTARAKGLPQWRILYGHALRNAVPRVLSGLPALVNVTLSSLIVVEYLTSWQGLGLMMAPWSPVGMHVRLTAALVYAVWFAIAEGLAQTIRLAVSPRLREVRA